MESGPSPDKKRCLDHLHHDTAAPAPSAPARLSALAKTAFLITLRKWTAPRLFDIVTVSRPLVMALLFLLVHVTPIEIMLRLVPAARDENAVFLRRNHMIVPGAKDILVAVKRARVGEARLVRFVQGVSAPHAHPDRVMFAHVLRSG